MASMNQHFTVTLTGGEVLALEVTPADQIRYELTANKEKWPAMESAPSLWMGFVSWAAAKRTRHTVLKWEEFRDQIENLETEDSEDDTVDPTGPAPESAG